MNNEEQELTTGEVEPSPELEQLNQSITDLVETLNTQMEIEQKEKEEHLKLEEEKQLAEIEQSLLTEEEQALEEEQQLQMFTIQEQQAATLDDVKAELQTLNTYTIQLTESIEEQKQNDVDQSFFLVFALIISIAVKILIDQFTKW